MQRDLSLCRLVMLEVERRNLREAAIVDLDGFEQEQVSYQVKLLYEAGLLHAVDASSHSGLCWIPRMLTWEGHDFLDASRDDRRWTEAIGTVKSKALSVGFDVLQSLLTSLAMRQLGLP